MRYYVQKPTVRTTPPPPTLPGKHCGRCTMKKRIFYLEETELNVLIICLVFFFIVHCLCHWFPYYPLLLVSPRPPLPNRFPTDSHHGRMRKMQGLYGCGIAISEGEGTCPTGLFGRNFWTSSWLVGSPSPTGFSRYCCTSRWRLLYYCAGKQ